MLKNLEINQESNLSSLQKNWEKNISKKVLVQMVIDLDFDVKKSEVLFQRELINNKILIKDIMNLRRKIEKLSEYNEILIQSNNDNSDKFDKINQMLDFYKGFYKQYISSIKERKNRKIATTVSLAKYKTQRKSVGIVNLPSLARPTLTIKGLI